MHAHTFDWFYAWLFVAQNALTGVSYVVIASAIWVRAFALVPARYVHLFAAFIFWCGAHHVAHALLPFGLPMRCRPWSTRS